MDATEFVLKLRKAYRSIDEELAESIHEYYGTDSDINWQATLEAIIKAAPRYLSNLSPITENIVRYRSATTDVYGNAGTRYGNDTTIRRKVYEFFCAGNNFVEFVKLYGVRGACIKGTYGVFDVTSEVLYKIALRMPNSPERQLVLDEQARRSKSRDEWLSVVKNGGKKSIERIYEKVGFRFTNEADRIQVPQEGLN